MQTQSSFNLTLPPVEQAPALNLDLSADQIRLNQEGMTNLISSLPGPQGLDVILEAIEQPATPTGKSPKPKVPKLQLAFAKVEKKKRAERKKPTDLERAKKLRE